MYRGSREYISPVTGSRTKQFITSVECWRNGSRNAESASGSRSMSDSWISWKPRIEEPSKPKPSSKLSSVSWDMGTEKCCINPGRSQKRRSTISAPASFARARTSFGEAMRNGSFPLVRGGPSRLEGIRGPGRIRFGRVHFALRNRPAFELLGRDVRKEHADRRAAARAILHPRPAAVELREVRDEGEADAHPL